MIDGVTVQPGPLGSVALPLTFSDQARVLDLSGDELTHSWAAIPEGHGPRTYAVRGNIIITPVTFTVGTTFTMFMRICVQTMDPDDLAALVASNYTLCDSTAHIFADEPFAWQEVEHRLVGPAGANNQGYNVRVDATVNRRLANDEALFIILESVSGSADCRCRLALRTLMGVE